MEAKVKEGFRAVGYMREVRDELAMLYQTDKRKFHNELKGAMASFLANRKTSVKEVKIGS